MPIDREGPEDGKTHASSRLPWSAETARIRSARGMTTDDGQELAGRRSGVSFTHGVAEPTWTERLVGRLTIVVETLDAAFDETERSAVDQFAEALFAEWFRERRERFAAIRRQLNQARMDVSYDRYLAHGALWVVIYAIVGATLGLAAAVVLTSALVGDVGLAPHVAVPGTVPQVVVDTLGVLVEPLWYLLFTLGGGLLLAGPLALYVWYRPRLAAYDRRREIQQLLPQAVTKMYALSHGDTTFPAIVRSLAEEEGTYGEVTRAFQAIQNDIDYFGADLRTALRDAREATPSDELAELFDDMISILDSGGALTPFLAEKTTEYQDRARRQNEDLLDTLGFFAELYVTVCVVGVLMVLVMLIVLTSISGSGYAQLWVVVYVGIPLVSLSMLLTVDVIFTDDSGTARAIPETADRVTAEQIADRLERPVAEERGTHTDMVTEREDDGTFRGHSASGSGSSVQRHRREDPHARTTGHDGTLSAIERTGLVQLHSALRRDRVLRQLRAPLAAMRRTPLVSLGVSLPAAVALIAVLAVTGISVPLPAHFLQTPIWTTTWSLVVPTVLVLTPIAYFHERRRYRYKRVSRELPDMLRKLSSASETGMTLAEALSLVADSSTGYLAEEFRKVDSELSNLNVSLEDALVRMANRVRHPRLTRVVKLLIEANTSGGRVRDVLAVVATDADTAYRLERERLGDMVLYMAIILLGNVIFLVISMILLTQLLPSLSAAAEGVHSLEAQQASAQAVPGLAETVRVTELTMLLYHGALLQSLVTGFLAGKLSYDDAWSGTKFAIAQLVITVAAFVLV